MADEDKILFQGEYFPTFSGRGFKPILKRFCEPLQGAAMRPIRTIEGKSVQPFWDGMDTPFLQGNIRPYAMEKCEKVSVCNCILMNRILTGALIAFPDADHDLPVLVLEWNETESVISLVCDLVPVVDLVMHEEYRAKYLDGLEQYWMKYKNLPGMVPNRFAWVRTMFSPYHLSGAIPKDTEQNVNECFAIIDDYLGHWINLWKAASPVADAKMRDYVRERIKKMRVIFRTGDEGAKTLAQMIGQETIDLLLTCNF